MGDLCQGGSPLSVTHEQWHAHGTYCPRKSRPPSEAFEPGQAARDMADKERGQGQRNRGRGGTMARQEVAPLHSPAAPSTSPNAGSVGMSLRVSPS